MSSGKNLKSVRHDIKVKLKNLTCTYGLRCFGYLDSPEKKNTDIEFKTIKYY